MRRWLARWFRSRERSSELDAVDLSLFRARSGLSSSPEEILALLVALPREERQQAMEDHARSGRAWNRALVLRLLQADEGARLASSLARNPSLAPDAAEAYFQWLAEPRRRPGGRLGEWIPPLLARPSLAQGVVVLMRRGHLPAADSELMRCLRWLSRQAPGEKSLLAALVAHPDLPLDWIPELQAGERDSAERLDLLEHQARRGKGEGLEAALRELAAARPRRAAEILLSLRLEHLHGFSTGMWFHLLSAADGELRLVALRRQGECGLAGKSAGGDR